MVKRAAQEACESVLARAESTCGEIASAVIYLVSEDSRYITGIAMPVDGGFLASGARGV